MMNQNVQTYRHEPQNKECNQASEFIGSQNSYPAYVINARKGANQMIKQPE